MGSTTKERGSSRRFTQAPGGGEVGLNGGYHLAGGWKGEGKRSIPVQTERGENTGKPRLLRGKGSTITEGRSSMVNPETEEKRTSSSIAKEKKEQREILNLTEARQPKGGGPTDYLRSRGKNRRPERPGYSPDKGGGRLLLCGKNNNALLSGREERGE